MKTGEIYHVNLDPTIGDEIKKSRPVVIINPGHMINLKLTIVVPVTMWKNNWKGNPFFIELFPNSQNGIKKKSAIDCYQVRSISHKRIIKKIGTIDEKQLDMIKSSISLILDIYPEHCNL